MNAKLFFSADYRDGRVRIGSKTYSAGYYCVQVIDTSSGEGNGCTAIAVGGH